MITIYLGLILCCCASWLFGHRTGYDKGIKEYVDKLCDEPCDYED